MGHLRKYLHWAYVALLFAFWAPIVWFAFLALWIHFHP